MRLTDRNSFLIHLFALLHAVVALGCRAFGIADDLMLTLLTMLLVVVLCIRGGMRTRFMAMMVVLVNVVGFALGNINAHWLGALGLPPMAKFPISTLITTEVIGWGTLWLVDTARKHRNPGAPGDTGGIKWLLVAFVLILCVRLVLLLTFSDSLNSENTLVNVIADYAFSCVAFIVLAEYGIRTNERALQQKAAADLAQYRYMKLKQQVNPHFLFNSLNILDCMVCDGQSSQASVYIHKLAGIYRYMIANEDATMVNLRDEMDFVHQYVDLLQVRFTDGFSMQADIPEEALSRKVVPCSLQLLIENAIKHNAVSPDNPLHIDIHADADSITVSNNIIPKQSTIASTGLGLNYIRQHYQDLSGTGIQVEDDGDHFTVILPLI